MTTKPKATINTPIDAPAGAMFGLKFHQVAIYHRDPMMAVQWWKNRGYDNWHYDHAILTGMEDGGYSRKRGLMCFNYDILPLELEYVCYNTATRHRNDTRDGDPPFISHLSTVVEDIEQEAHRLHAEYSMLPYHQFVTSEHTNPNVKGRKRFREAIFDTGYLLGFDIKLIQRVLAI